jgi:hypothetical protein
MWPNVAFDRLAQPSEAPFRRTARSLCSRMRGRRCGRPQFASSPTRSRPFAKDGRRRAASDCYRVDRGPIGEAPGWLACARQRLSRPSPSRPPRALPQASCRTRRGLHRRISISWCVNVRIDPRRSRDYAGCPRLGTHRPHGETPPITRTATAMSVFGTEHGSRLQALWRTRTANPVLTISVTGSEAGAGRSQESMLCTRSGCAGTTPHP